jgi:hypothetical protein
MYLNQFNLQLELPTLGLMVTHQGKDKQSSDIFDQMVYMDYMHRGGFHPSPLIIRNVEYEKDLEIFGFNTIEVYIMAYRYAKAVVSPNFLAISPDKTKQFLVRLRELTYFVKYFENWTILPYTAPTSQAFRGEYSQFFVRVLHPLGLKWSLSQCIEFALIYIVKKESSRIAINSLRFNDVYDEYYHLGILQLFEHEAGYYENWINFCNKLYFAYAVYVELQYYGNYKLIPFHSGYLDTRLDHIQQFAKVFQHVEFFHMHYTDLETQKPLFVDLPFDLEGLVAF